MLLCTDTLFPRQFPKVDGLEICCIGVELCGDAANWIEAALPFTTANEHSKAQRFVHAVDAARHLMGRAMARCALRTALSQPFCEDFAYTPWGKPFLPQREVEFSITHSGCMVWIALCRQAAVGIDVEKVCPVPELSELTSMLHPAERKVILSSPEDVRLKAFYRCWTRKEATLKATGKGLNQALDSFEIDAGEKQAHWIVTPPQDNDHKTNNGTLFANSRSAWTAHDIATDEGYQCSVAACAPGLKLSVYRIANVI